MGWASGLYTAVRAIAGAPKHLRYFASDHWHVDHWKKVSNLSMIVRVTSVSRRVAVAAELLRRTPENTP